MPEIHQVLPPETSSFLSPFAALPEVLPPVNKISVRNTITLAHQRQHYTEKIQPSAHNLPDKDDEENNNK